MMGQQCLQGHIPQLTGNYSFDLEKFISGTYFIKLRDTNGVVYNVKVIKE